MTVYIIHLEANLSHARHYVGFANHAQQRRKLVAHHRNGSGARILAVCNERGIAYRIARTWDGEGRTFERKLKRCKNTARYCPLCNPRATEYKPKR